jgi:hypothetical protein
LLTLNDHYTFQMWRRQPPKLDREKPIDVFARAVSVLSLVVSIAAAAVPAWQFRQEHNEAITVKAEGAPQSGMLHLTNYNLGSNGWVVQVPVRITFSNICSRRVSLIKSDLDAITSRGSTMQYSGMDGGFYDLAQSASKLPIVLDAGESKELELRLGILVPKQVDDVLKTAEKGKPLSLLQARLALAEKGMDLGGNPVELKKFSRGEYIITGGSSELSMPIAISFTSGAGHQFSTILSHQL